MRDDDLSSADPFGEIADEFVEAIRQGKRPLAEEFARRYPEHADDLRNLLPALGLMERARSAGATPADGGKAAVASPRQLGAYQILLEAGQGGMGRAVI